MGIALSTLARLFSPVHALFRSRGSTSAARRGSHQPIPGQPAAAFAAPAHAPMHRPLRVVRVVDPRHGHRGAGRMVISGRMADVCAELERLAALEAASAA